ncbi:MAG: hypothetical protein ACKO9Z_04465 [Planctomycetota bacterium]
MLSAVLMMALSSGTTAPEGLFFKKKKAAECTECAKVEAAPAKGQDAGKPQAAKGQDAKKGQDGKKQDGKAQAAAKGQDGKAQPAPKAADKK